MILIIFIAKEQDRVDRVSAYKERFVGRERSGYTAEARVCDEDCGDAKGTVCICL